MKIKLVVRISDPTFIGKTLSRDDIAFAIVPQPDDVVFWNDGWSGMTCRSRYVGQDYVQLNLETVNKDDVAAFVEAGWTLR